MIAAGLGSDSAKVSLDIRRPWPLYGSCFHLDVMSQMGVIYRKILEVIRLLEQKNVLGIGL